MFRTSRFYHQVLILLADPFALLVLRETAAVWKPKDSASFSTAAPGAPGAGGEEEDGGEEEAGAEADPWGLLLRLVSFQCVTKTFAPDSCCGSVFGSLNVSSTRFCFQV